MYARVARWEGGDPEALRQSASQMKERAASGPPPGVPGKGFLLLVDAAQGSGLAIGLFETEEDLQTGDRALRAMDPPGEGMGSVTSIEMYEVAVDVGVASLQG
jgi:hypothetical protein